MKVKQARPAKFSTRAYTRCRICGRPHSVLRKYGVCRICFRELAYAGQKPLVTKSKKSIANFKLRAGMNVGAKVTLRGDRMYEFADKLVSIVLPRVRDFRGVSAKAFDGRGNYSLGVREQLIFPEIEYDKVEKIRGMEMVFVTTAKTDEEAKELLRLMGMPFQA